MSRYNNEAAGLKNAIIGSRRYFHGDDNDCLLEKIFEQVLEEWRNPKGINTNKMPKFEEPFVNAESPDIYYIGDDFILGVEHFQFDSSKKKRGGSSLQQEEARVDKEIIRDYRSQVKDEYYTEREINVHLSFENYINSLLESFKRHYNNVLEYKNNLKKYAPDKKVILAFYIEDITSVGNYIVNQKGREHIIPFCVKEFLDVLQNSLELDYVMVHVRRDYIPYMYILQMKEQYIKECYEECYDYSKDLFVDYKPIVATHIGGGHLEDKE